MKKIIVFLFFISLLYLIVSTKNDSVIIPNESIRYRIIANSNSPEDQLLKWKVNEKVVPLLIDSLKNSNTYDDSYKFLSNSLDTINSQIEKFTSDYQINLGLNYFPEKKYDGITYPKGDYSSLVITLGDGLGDNWWCILFPPLCLMEIGDVKQDSINYDFYFKNVLKR